MVILFGMYIFRNIIFVSRVCMMLMSVLYIDQRCYRISGITWRRKHSASETCCFCFWYFCVDPI